MLHNFFPEATQVAGADILPWLQKTLPKAARGSGTPALMDYGAFLKRSGVRLNTKVKGYVKQSAFEGSGRQARGAILRTLATKPATGLALMELLGPERRTQLQRSSPSLPRKG